MQSSSENSYIISNIQEFDEFVKNKNEKSDYKCRIFSIDEKNPVIFPKGTISYIGARTGRGKTTALIDYIQHLRTSF